MHSLRWLCADWGVLAAASHDILSSVEALECVQITGMPEPGEDGAFWSWAARHPPLRHLSLQTALEAVPPHVLEAVVRLREARPILRVFCSGSAVYPEFGSNFEAERNSLDFELAATI
jgi:hypothetical protein